MTGLEDLDCGSFTPHVGSFFRAIVEEEVYDLRLTEAVEVDRDAEGGRKAFSILFQGPVGLLIPQGTYRLENETMGQLDLFLVPIQPDDEGSRFEAIFT